MTREEAKIKKMDYHYLALKLTHRDSEQVDLFIDKIYDDFEARDKLKKCENCKHKDAESGTLTHCSYFEQFMPTEIGKCDIWESKDAGII